MVALAILVLMLLIVFVPVNIGINLFYLGKANADVQSGSTLAIQQIESDLQQAIYVYPNAQVPGVTDLPPYNGQPPYYQSTVNPCASAGCTTGLSSWLEPSVGSTPTQVCAGATMRASNPTRLDMILGSVNQPTGAANQSNNTVTPTYVVSYYTRRLNPMINYSTTDPQNLMVLYRFQSEIPSSTGSTAFQNDLNLLSTRYSGSCSNFWTQDYNGEPDLTYFSNNYPNFCWNNRAVGINMASVASNAVYAAPPAPTPTPASPNSFFQPNTSFTCIDTVGDGKIHRVIIDMMLGEYDAVGAGSTNGQQNLQTVHVKQTVDLPNVH